MTWNNERDVPVARDEKPFDTILTHEDQQTMREYRNTVINQTSAMTGLDIKARLNRIDAEVKRLDAVQVHLTRLRKLTMEAVYSGENES